MRDVTDDYIMLRQRELGEFKRGAFSAGDGPVDFVTFSIDELGGVKAVYGELKGGGGEIQSYLFEKENWTDEKARAWVKRKKGGHKARDVQSNHRGFAMRGGDPRFRVEVNGGDLLLKAMDGDQLELASQGVSLNSAGLEHARSLIRAGHVDEHKAWSLSPAMQNKILGSPANWKKYASWHLAINGAAAEKTKGRYKFPFGDGKNVSRAALASAAQRASQFGYSDVQKAASSLVEMIKSEMSAATIADGDQLLALRDLELLRDFTLAESKVPSEFLMWPFGEVSVTDPRYPPTLVIDEDTALRTMAYYRRKVNEKAGAKLYGDWSHNISRGIDEKASCWWVPEVRADGIWATQIDWTPDAQMQLEKREIRHYSPEGKWRPITKDKGHVEYLTAFGLTNKPASDQQIPLVAKAEGEPSPERRRSIMENLFKELGLKDTDTEETAIKAVKDLKAKAEKSEKDLEAKEGEVKDLQTKLESKEESDEVKGLKDFRAKALEAHGLKAEDGIEKLEAKVETMKAQEPDKAKLADLETKVQAQAETLETYRVKDLMAKVDKKVVPANEKVIEKMARSLEPEEFLATMKEWPDVKADPEQPISRGNLADRNVGEIQDEQLLTKADIEHLEKTGRPKGSDGYKSFVEQRRKDVKDGLYNLG